jgi:hypothetical protein
MAKKEKKKDKKGSHVEHDAVASVRAAVERTLQVSAEGAQVTRDRTREIVDEISQAAGRIRHTLEDMRVLDEVKSLRREVEALAARVASLELPSRSEPASAPLAVADPAAPSASKRAAARKPALKRAAAKRPAATPPAAKPAARKRAATKRPAATAASKPPAAPAS